MSSYELENSSFIKNQNKDNLNKANQTMSFNLTSLNCALNQEIVTPAKRNRVSLNADVPCSPDTAVGSDPPEGSSETHSERRLKVLTQRLNIDPGVLSTALREEGLDLIEVAAEAAEGSRVLSPYPSITSNKGKRQLVLDGKVMTHERSDNTEPDPKRRKKYQDWSNMPAIVCY